MGGRSILASFGIKSEGCVMTSRPKKSISGSASKKKAPKKKDTNINQTEQLRRLDSTRLGMSSRLVPKTFKPFGLRGMETEQDVIDVLTISSEAGDTDASMVLKLLESFTVNDLIVEGIIRLEK